jgi:ATP-dependent Clp protease ATP-binding subunit ClpX
MPAIPQVCAFCGGTGKLLRFRHLQSQRIACLTCLRRYRDELKNELTKDTIAQFLPHIIKARLDEYVIGQERAKKVLAVAAYNHLKRVNEAGTRILVKANIILIGPTGCGKTLLGKALAKALDVPFVLVDCSKITEAGYVGEKVGHIAKAALIAANWDPDLAGRAVVFLDELDKSAIRKTHRRDIRGEGVQRGLLKMVEGGIYRLSREKTHFAEAERQITVDTTNMLFIAAGTFDEARRRHAERLNPEKNIGFVPTAPRIANPQDKQIAATDLNKSGFLPELVGRMPVRVLLDALDENAMVKIITEPKDAVFRQYKKLFESHMAVLQADDVALRAIGHIALASGNGARGLRGIFENLLLESMFDIEAFCTYTITLADGQPTVVKKNPNAPK